MIQLEDIMPMVLGKIFHKAMTLEQGVIRNL